MGDGGGAAAGGEPPEPVDCSKLATVPAEFEELGKSAENKGFLYVASGPMVRSSYRAGEFFIQGVIEKRRARAGAVAHT